MLKLIQCEFRKLKRKRLFQVAFLTTVIMPILYSMLLSENNFDNIMSIIREENGFLLLIPITVILAANLFFEEHDCDTLKNLMCVPVTKGRLTVAKLTVLLIFDIGYQTAGYLIGFLLSFISGVSTEGWMWQFLLTVEEAVLLWAAAMPCVFLVVWCNRSYIISVIFAFAYVVLNYILRINERFIMAPVGVNLPTFIPVPMIFRWLYQFHPMEGAGEELLGFYQRLRPYFVSGQVIFMILLGEAAVFIFLIIQVYKRQDV